MQTTKTTILMAMFATALMATTASAAPDHGARVAGRGTMHVSGASHFNAGGPRINNSAATPRINAGSSGVRTNFSGDARTAQFSDNRSTSGWRQRGYRRGNFGAGFGAGIATGALIGGATYAYGGYPYGYGDADYGYDDHAYDDGYAAYAEAPIGYGAYAEAPVANDEAYCEQRFRSYDPASGTYLGYDGLRHPCP
jgi:hypothetical protein